MPSILQRLKRSLPLRNMAATDRQMLLFCIALAFVFWLILNLSQEYEINKEVDLTYDAGPERVIAGNPPRSIPVQLRGRGWNLIWESLRGSHLEVTLDMSELSELQLNGNLLRQQISRQLSSGDVEVDNMGYETQQIYTTPRDGKRVPVISRVELNFRSGYFAPDGPVLRPDSVTVSGAADALEDITNWPTVVTTREGIESNTTFTVPLEAPPEGLTLNYREVTVGMRVEAFIEQQIRVPVVLHDAPTSDSSRVFPSYVTVTVNIPQREYGHYGATDFRVEADLSRMQASDDHNTLPLVLTRVPETIKSVTFSPRAVEYYVYRQDN